MNKKVFAYLALGDSYTKGEAVLKNESFPAVLSERIMSKLKKVVDTKIIATTGWRTDELIAAVKKEPLNKKYDLVTLLIGVNNQYQKKAFTVYEQEFKELVELALDLVEGKVENVLVLSIPDYAFTPLGKGEITISEEIDRYNEYALRVTIEKNIDFLNITDITRQGLVDPTLVAEDQLHISAKVYEQVAERIFKLKYEHRN